MIFVNFSFNITHTLRSYITTKKKNNNLHTFDYIYMYFNNTFRNINFFILNDNLQTT